MGSVWHNALQVLLNVKTLEIFTYDQEDGLVFANSSYNQFLQCAAYINNFCEDWYASYKDKFTDILIKANQLFAKMLLLKENLHIIDKNAFSGDNYFWLLVLGDIANDIDLGLCTEGLEFNQSPFFKIEEKFTWRDVSNDLPF